MNIKQIIYVSPLALLMACNNPNQEKQETKPMAIEYPKTKTVPHTDTINGVIVTDDYRWLENDTAAETVAWVDEQIKTTQSYLEKIPFRDKLKKRITEMANYPKYGSPFKVGDY